MSLITKSKISPEGVYAIWRVTESDEYFLQNLSLFEGEKLEIATLKSRKKTEWLSSRYLLHILSERTKRGACLKDEYGKPFLEGSDYQISISHTEDYVAVIGSPANVGIDIQSITPKIEKIAPKFIRDDEYAFIPISESLWYCHTIWGAKEAMYKAYGKKNVLFKENMKVSPFIFKSEGFYFEGFLENQNYNAKFQLYCKIVENLILVYGVEIK